ncbi:MAG: TrkH family potassium uptake protein [Huintestinicola sp.]
MKFDFGKLAEGFQNRKKKSKLSSAKFIALGFLLIIAIGTCLLMLPAASKGEQPKLLDAMFTAVSASCVTGLVVFDTFSRWTVFGQTVILVLIQIGGLGVMTIISMVSVLLGRKIGLKERSILQDSVNNMQIGGIIRLMKKIFKGTFLIEGIGAVLLAIRMIPELGAGKGIYSAVFTSISAFCNAGFDLNGRYGEYSSLVHFYNDPLVNITVMLLIIIGGIGFVVWEDVLANKFKFSAYRLHSKIVLVMTAVLTFGGAVIFFLFEYNNPATIGDMNMGEKILVSFFNSITPRTAGFNTVDTALLTPASKFLTIVYMFIGGSPGSTAGGAKTVTIAVLIISALSNLRSDEDCNVFGRRLDEDAPGKALAVVTVNISLIIFAVIAISANQPEFALTDVVFEAFSAIDTVGMTTGITRALSPFSRCVIMFLMYCGRVGSVSFALIFTRNKRYTGVHNPTESVSIG